MTFYFVEEGPGRASEDVKRECNVNCFDFFFFSVFFDGRHGWKNHSQLKRIALKQKNKKKCTPEKSQKRTKQRKDA